MSNISLLQNINLSGYEANSNQVVTDAKGTIRSVNVIDKDGKVKLFINIEDKDGNRFADVITFGGDEAKMEATMKYLAVHIGNLTANLGDDEYLASYDQIMGKLQAISDEKKEFTFSTIQSTYNPAYVDVVYGDEVRM